MYEGWVDGQQMKGAENRTATEEEVDEKPEQHLSTLGLTEIVAGISSHT